MRRQNENAWKFVGDLLHTWAVVFCGAAAIVAAYRIADACPAVASLCTPTIVGASCTKVSSESVAASATATATVLLPANAHVDAVTMTGTSSAWTPTSALVGRRLTITATNTSGSAARLTANVTFDYGGLVNFETGDIYQGTWIEASCSGYQDCRNALAITTSQARSGTYSMHAITTIGDSSVNGHAHRAELGVLPPEIGNSIYVLGEQWYGVSTYIPSAWSDDDTSCSNCSITDHYHLITQWHHDDSVTPGDIAMQPLQLNVFDSTIRFEHFYGDVHTSAIILWTTPLDPLKGAWHDWVVHANWSTDPAVGYITIWKDGVQIVDYHDHTAHPTGGGVSWKAGLTYDVEETRDAYIDEMRMKSGACGSYAAVAPR